MCAEIENLCYFPLGRIGGFPDQVEVGSYGKEMVLDHLVSRSSFFRNKLYCGFDLQ